MTKPVLGIDDVLLQVGLCVVLHWVFGDAWTAKALSTRIGAVVPAALILLAAYRIYGPPSWKSTP